MSPQAVELDELEDDDLLEAEIDETEDEIEELDEIPPLSNQTVKKAKKAKKPKRTLSKENKFTFETKNEAKEGLENLKYSDGTSVEGYRVWRIVRQTEKDENPVTQLFTIARTNQEACMRFCYLKKYAAHLEDKKSRGGGPGKRKISESTQIFGKEFAKSIFVDQKPNGKLLPTAPESMVEVWKKQFGPEGTYAHYIDENNNWKAFTSD